MNFKNSNILGKGEIIALYPTACIMEHSCISNTKYTFNMEDFKINVFASCDIEKYVF